jgi:hypothetical protein
MIAVGRRPAVHFVPFEEPLDPTDARAPLKKRAAISDTFFAMYSETLCSQCGLTLAAIGLLAGVVRDMRRSRTRADSWRMEICPACGEVTGVFDDEEGWAMGHRAPVHHPERVFVPVP